MNGIDVGFKFFEFCGFVCFLLFGFSFNLLVFFFWVFINCGVNKVFGNDCFVFLCWVLILKFEIEVFWLCNGFLIVKFLVFVFLVFWCIGFFCKFVLCLNLLLLIFFIWFLIFEMLVFLVVFFLLFVDECGKINLLIWFLVML